MFCGHILLQLQYAGPAWGRVPPFFLPCLFTFSSFTLLFFPLFILLFALPICFFRPPLPFLRTSSQDRLTAEGPG